jgi:hypothetical protein
VRTEPSLQGGGKPKPGDKCTPNDASTCDDTTSGLVCVEGTVVSMPCRGPEGCTGTGPSFQCDDALGVEGEPCRIPPSGMSNVACTIDNKQLLGCEAGRWKLVSGCKGPKGCKISGVTVQCDDDVADLGDTCRTQANEENYACTPDKKQEVVCQGNTFVSWRFCKGPLGCHITNDTISCDSSFADEGDVCRVVDYRTCAANGKSLLRCSPQFKWTKAKDCTKDGCKVEGNSIYCR